MFDIGWSELVVIGVVALIAIGPKELPGVLRSLGQWTGKICRMSAEFQGQFREALREAEMDDLKKQAEEVQSAVSDFTHFDPLATPSEEKAADTPSVTASDETPIEAQIAEELPPPQEQAPVEAVLEPPAATNIDTVEPSPPAKSAGGAA